MIFLLDPLTHDLDTTGGKLNLASREQELAQKIKTRLLLVRGECYLYPNKGVPWFEEVFGVAVDLSAVKALLSREILDVPDVESILAFEVTLNRTSRTYILDCTVKASFGQVTISGLEL